MQYRAERLLSIKIRNMKTYKMLQWLKLSTFSDFITFYLPAYFCQQRNAAIFFILLRFVSTSRRSRFGLARYSNFLKPCHWKVRVFNTFIVVQQRFIFAFVYPKKLELMLRISVNRSIHFCGGFCCTYSLLSIVKKIPVRNKISISTQYHSIEMHRVAEIFSNSIRFVER